MATSMKFRLGESKGEPTQLADFQLRNTGLKFYVGE